MTDYGIIFHEEILRFKDSLCSEFDNEEFPWDQLIHVFLLENSPLPEIFSKETVLKANVCRSAYELYQNSEKLNNVNLFVEDADETEEVNDVNLEGDW